MAPYTGECEFCGEEVGPPDQRAHLAFADLTVFPEDGARGVRVRKELEDWQDPDDKADISVHQECLTAWWDGVVAGIGFYTLEE